MHRYAVADVFTDRPLEGNQLAVFFEARDLDERRMQRTARELNLSETIFVLPPETSGADARIRIFTPGAELPFAGHPVLGSAIVLGSERTDVSRIRLQTGAGVIPVDADARRRRPNHVRRDETTAARDRAVRAQRRAARGARGGAL